VLHEGVLLKGGFTACLITHQLQIHHELVELLEVDHDHVKDVSVLLRVEEVEIAIVRLLLHIIPLLCYGVMHETLVVLIVEANEDDLDLLEYTLSQNRAVSDHFLDVDSAFLEQGVDKLFCEGELVKDRLDFSSTHRVCGTFRVRFQEV